jgi:uncharacterized protein with HEPN domain
LDQDEVLQMAMIGWVEIIGEAANNVHPDIQLAYPDVPWRQIVGMRNHITHGYFEVDYDTLWNVLAIDVPAVVPLIQAILETLPENQE